MWRKKIKFPLKLNGADCRTLSEVRENWNVKDVYVYFVDGRLLTWCKDRHYIQADKIAELSTEDADARKKLCEIFDVEYVADDSDSDDWRPKTPKEVEKYNRLKNYTADEDTLKKFRQVAFDRDELDDLIDEYDEIYLCNATFEEFPIGVANKTYIGIGKAVAVIPSQKIVDFDEKNIKFKNINVDDGDNGSSIPVPSEKPVKSQVEEWFELAEKASDEKDYQTAFELYRKAADCGHVEAMAGLAYMYYDNTILPNIADKSKAFDLAQKAAELGDTDAMFLVGMMYLQGEGTPQVVYKGLYWLEKAAELEDTDAMEELGEIYRNGDFDVTADATVAFKWYKKAAEAGDAEAMNVVGRMYDFGEGVAHNGNQAMKWYKKAAGLGNTVAMCNLSFYYFHSHEWDMAEVYLKKALDNGYKPALTYLGDLYRERGNYSDYSSSQADYQTALVYYTQSANEGNADAMCSLGVMYHKGNGVNKDDKMALEWLYKAKAKGHPHAEEWIKKIKGCFITTAVCDSFNKPDDCFELTTFRNFRDNWLALQSDGKILIEEYYKIAPQIVANIDKLTNANEIYKKLWCDWLAPCLEFIKVGDNVACKDKYVEMVNRLKKLYL